MGKIVESPGFTVTGPARHERVAPEETAASSALQVDSLDQTRAGKRNDGIPETVELAVGFNLEARFNRRRVSRARGVNLLRRLRDEQHARAACDTYPLFERVAAKHPRPRAREDDICVRPRV